MSEWVTIRVTLTGRPGQSLDLPPARIVLAHVDHTFADLADVLDVSFGRWDLSPDHAFGVDGRRITSGGAFDRDDAEDSDDTTLGEAGLYAGKRLSYEFDAEERWRHALEVEDAGVDPLDFLDEEPDEPTCVDGWGDLPDQYGRRTEDEDEDAGERAASWEVVDTATAHRPAEPDEAALAEVMERLRAAPDEWPHRLLWRAADLSPNTAPDDAVAAWEWLALSVIDPASPSGTDADADVLALLAALDSADWAGAVIELVRDGVGAPAEPARLRERIAVCPEIEGEDLSADDAAVVERGMEAVVPLWQALGALDADRRLTPLGAWGLPEALRLAWTSEIVEPAAS